MKEVLEKTISSVEQQSTISPDEISLAEAMPSMSVTISPQEEEKCIIDGDDLKKLYDEILDCCREDRKKVDELVNIFSDLVLNAGDASSSSKEVLASLVKVKTDISDKMAKIADLQCRHILKARDTFPRYLAHQTNNVNIEATNKREILKNLQQSKSME